MGESTYELQDQLKAAYALNMCTVSVSQIVDYNDEYILEQEYEAILNNLNLEQMPKDEALLEILVKLLNVITFFRIDKVKRAQIERKYQRDVKNAIWSAVPNIGVIVAGDPVTVGISLATQVGIGYMNYRRAKASAQADREDAEIELRLTAMEQFNALRRELFTTAWRLADEYNFPDEFRLTERQIAQYDKILMDTDEIRKYERLMSVQDKFEAYLPFWYFMGHSAKYISEDKTNGLEGYVREYYRSQARRHFEKYDRLNSFNLLREDEITASFALEYIDLLLLDEDPDNEKIARLIKTAVKMAGNANDILELCAIAYLKIGETDEAERLFRMLVNEGYNAATNAKLLSRIYVSQYLEGSDPLARTNYASLALRVPSTWMFPMPETRMDDRLLQDGDLRKRYLNEQKDALQRDFRDSINQFIDKYIVLFNRIIPVPMEHAPESYFWNTEEAIARRRQDVEKALEGDRGKEYRIAIRDSRYRVRYIELVNDMLRALDSISLFRDFESKREMIRLIRGNLRNASDGLAEIQNKLDKGDKFTVEDYETILKSYSLERITGVFFARLKTEFTTQIEGIDTLDVLDDLEIELFEFRQEQGLGEIGGSSHAGIADPESDAVCDYIPMDDLGQDVQSENEKRIVFDKMLDVVKKSASSIAEDDKKVKFLVSGSSDFDRYFKNGRLKAGAIKASALGVIDDRSRADNDLLITCDGVIQVKRNKAGGLRKFDKIKNAGSSISLGWPEDYSNSAVNIGNLYELLEKLGKIADGAKRRS